MARMQLFELEDMPWLPGSLRDAGTDFLRTLMALARPYARVVPRRDPRFCRTVFPS